MKTRQATMALAAVAICLSLTVVAVYYLFFHQHSEAPVRRVPDVVIHLYTVEERLRANSADASTLEPTSFKIIFPNDQVNNPVIFSSRYCFARVSNTTGEPLTCYQLYEPFPSTPSIHHAFLVETEVRDNNNTIVIANPDPSVSFSDMTATVYKKAGISPNEFTLQPGEHVDLTMSVLGKLSSHNAGLKSGVYTIRAIVSYAEAPSGEKKQITSEPVQIAVTAEHIKAAEEYWAGREKK